MKSNKKYILISVLIFFLGALGMYLLISYVPLKTKTITEVNNEYKIEETAVEQAIDKVYDAVVVVESFSNNRKIGTGTGFIYKKDNKYGYVMTNSHVIGNGNQVKILLSDGKEIDAKILGKDALSDIAVLSISSNNVKKVAEIGNSENTKLGNTVITVGAPMGSEYSGTVTKGILSGKDRMLTVSLSSYSSNDLMIRVLQTDAAINPGNSGGPLVNIAGQVIGITSLKLVQSEVEGMGFAIPIEDAMRYVEDLESGKEISRPFIGIEMLDVNEVYSLFIEGIILDEEIEKGVVIINVTENSPAEKIGLKRGDIILKMGDKEIDNKAQLRYELYKYKVGDKLKIFVYRDEKISEYTLTLISNEN
ncbi:MAG: S1C family serine protease [Bacilli bacterium]|nr:S1C family serine protease [Bacilli bacterium]MDD3995237.1 S1C family serine protease [Bacilli bacterium]